MRLTSFFALFAVITSAAAHSRIWGVSLNGVDQGDGRNQYIRSPPSTSPIKPVNSPDLNCNVNGNRTVPSRVSVKAGDYLSFQWYLLQRGDNVIDRSHKGPLLVYMSNSAGKEWTKIFEDGYNGKWAVDRLIEKRGYHSVIIPDVPAGDYILRAEIIALHEADAKYSQNPARGAQFYPNCVQIKVTSNGTKKLPGGATFPGAYAESDPGISFNIYEGGPSHWTYKVPGPAVWSEGRGVIGLATPGKRSVATRTPSIYGATTKAASRAISLGEVELLGQCGGRYYAGPTNCVAGAFCSYVNSWYWQCRSNEDEKAIASAGVAL